MTTDQIDAEIEQKLIHIKSLATAMIGNVDDNVLFMDGFRAIKDAIDAIDRLCDEQPTDAT